MEKSWDKYELWGYLGDISEKQQLSALREIDVYIEYDEEIKGWALSSLPDFFGDEQWNAQWDELEHFLEDVEEIVMDNFEIYEMEEMEEIVMEAMKEISLKKSLGGEL